MKTLEQKQVEAQTRQAESAALTPAQRLAKLDLAFGKGIGAAKERAKLAKLLNPSNVVAQPGPKAAQDQEGAAPKAKRAKGSKKAKIAASQ